ncbi:hypothetical protein BC629DRAFT_1443507 [Irpex lacteus]|nr:hypothetical protein BC629DRAFT_1443507 [Irpex lacteus]
MEFTNEVGAGTGYFHGSWGLRDHWKHGMHRPHPRLGWFPLSVKGGAICHWSMTSRHDYYQFLSDGYHSDYDFEQNIGYLPRRMHLCLVCKSIFDASFNNTVSHCDSITHRNRLTDVLDLEYTLPSGVHATSPEQELAYQLESMGINQGNSLYDEIPKATASWLQHPPNRPTHSPASSTSSSTGTTLTVDLPALFAEVMRISSTREAEYNDLLGAMKCMGLK